MIKSTNIDFELKMKYNEMQYIFMTFSTKTVQQYTSKGSIITVCVIFKLLTSRY